MVAFEGRTQQSARELTAQCLLLAIGWLLMDLMIEYARAEGLQSIRGQVLQENRTMLQMCRQLGFHIAPDPDETSMVIVTLSLKP
jgi:acetyltransferase